MLYKHSSETCEWYTPPEIINKVHQVMGYPDLDPASCEYANKTVRARQFFTEDDYPLLRTWTGSVFLNPPSGKGLPKLFWEKLVTSPIEHAIFIGFNIEQLAILQDCTLCPFDYSTCFLRKRIKFVSPNGEKTRPAHSNFITYTPGNIDRSKRFEEVFEDLGYITS
jgi:hypothetical protein